MGFRDRDGKRIVVTLIHGTFAPNTAWVQEGSSFCSGLRKHLGGNVDFHRICWGGANTTAARQHGGEMLAAHILRVFRDEPNVPHFVVGHSHAGNLSLYALSDPEVRDKLSGIVTMNTPFVSVLRRNPFQLITVMGALAISWMLPLCVIYPIAYLGHTGFVEWSRHLSWWQLFLFGLLGCAAINAVSWLLGGMGVRMVRLLKRVAQWTVARRESLVQDVGLPHTTTPLLAMRCAGDEVVGLIGITSTIANIPFAVLYPWSLLATFCLLFTAHWTGRIPSLIPWFFAMPGSYMNSAVNRLGATVAMPTVQYIFSSGIYLVALVCVVLAVAAALVPFFRMLPIGLGWRHLFDSLFVSLSFTVTPVTSERTEFVDVDPLSTGLLTLGHFKIHDHPDVLRVIAAWMKIRAVNSTLDCTPE